MEVTATVNTKEMEYEEVHKNVTSLDKLMEELRGKHPGATSFVLLFCP